MSEFDGGTTTDCEVEGNLLVGTGDEIPAYNKKGTKDRREKR